MAVLYTAERIAAAAEGARTVAATAAVLSVDAARAMLAARVPLDETWGAHSETVARVAGVLADALRDAGADVNPDLARAGGLLHDIGRCVTHDGTGHCIAGYRMLKALGQPTLARFCAVHSYGGMTPDEAATVGWPAADYRPRTWEEKAVTVADGLAHGDRVVLRADRHASVLERYRDKANPVEYALLVGVRPKMHRLFAEIEAAIGQPIEPLVGAEPL